MFGKERPSRISFQELNHLKSLSCEFCLEEEPHVRNGLHLCYNSEGDCWAEWAEGQKQICFSQRHSFKEARQVEIWKCQLEKGKIIGVKSAMVVAIFDPPIFSGLLQEGLLGSLSGKVKLPEDAVVQAAARAWFERLNLEIPEEDAFQIINRENGTILEKKRQSSELSFSWGRTNRGEDNNGYIESWLWNKDGLGVNLERIDIFLALVPPLLEGILPAPDQVHSVNFALVRENPKKMSKYERELFFNPSLQLKAFSRLIKNFP